MFPSGFKNPFASLFGTSGGDSLQSIQIVLSTPKYLSCVEIYSRGMEYSGYEYAMNDTAIVQLEKQNSQGQFVPVASVNIIQGSSKTMIGIYPAFTKNKNVGSILMQRVLEPGTSGGAWHDIQLTGFGVYNSNGQMISSRRDSITGDTIRNEQNLLDNDINTLTYTDIRQSKCPNGGENCWENVSILYKPIQSLDASFIVMAYKGDQGLLPTRIAVKNSDGQLLMNFAGDELSATYLTIQTMYMVDTY